MSIPGKLKKAREYLGKKQKEMGALVGVGISTWQVYELGKSVPGGKVFEALARLGFNTHWFFSDDTFMLTDDLKYLHHIPKDDQPRSNESQAPYGTPHPMPDDDIGLGESVELLAKIYNSGNPVLIRAIAANLHAFSEAVDNKAIAAKTINMMEEMNQRMNALEKELARMRLEESAPKQAAANGD